MIFICSQAPSVLAKVFGVYRLLAKDIVNNKTFRLDFLIMENVFYNKKISHVRNLFVFSTLDIALA